ncbi:MAG TPA: hypothetical protein VJI68_00215 [Candidatus Nanoarchaeia archaeon]|nr:hypothetical protein [Candidatus Nanoarchaeia archaeon]
MKKITIAFLVLMCLLLVLSGCKGNKTPKNTTGFIGGTEGISSQITIESTSGNNNVFDNGVDPFYIDVTLENKGEDEAAEGEVLVTLDNINFNAFQIQDPTKRNDISLSGLRKEGGKTTDAAQTIVRFNANYKPDEVADRTVSLSVNSCYKYQTISRVKDLCLRKKITSPGTTDTCKVDEAKIAENSGAPFRIKTFTESPAGENKVRIFIEAMNEGKGTIYSKDYLSQGKCIDSEENKNKIYAKIQLTEVTNSASIITCSGLDKNEGNLNVIQNKVQLSCMIDTSSLQDSTFETPLQVTFDYVYKDGATTTLTIKSSI